MTRPKKRTRSKDATAVHDLATIAAREALERRGADIVVMDLRDLTSATDFFVLASGESDVQVKAIAERVEERLEGEDVRPWHVEGRQRARWVLLDYVDFVVHVFHHEARAYYDLERLWGDAPMERLEEPDATGDSSAVN